MPRRSFPWAKWAPERGSPAARGVPGASPRRRAGVGPGLRPARELDPCRGAALRRGGSASVGTRGPSRGGLRFAAGAAVTPVLRPKSAVGADGCLSTVFAPENASAKSLKGLGKNFRLVSGRWRIALPLAVLAVAGILAGSAELATAGPIGSGGGVPTASPVPTTVPPAPVVDHQALAKSLGEAAPDPSGENEGQGEGGGEGDGAESGTTSRGTEAAQPEKAASEQTRTIVPPPPEPESPSTPPPPPPSPLPVPPSDALPEGEETPEAPQNGEAGDVERQDRLPFPEVLPDCPRGRWQSGSRLPPGVPLSAQDVAGPLTRVLNPAFFPADSEPACTGQAGFGAGSPSSGTNDGAAPSSASTQSLVWSGLAVLGLSTILTYLLWSAFSRLEPGGALTHPRRARIIEFVSANPGIGVQGVVRSLGLSKSIVQYHVFALGRAGHLKRHRVGGRTALFVSNAGHRGREVQLALLRRETHRRVHGILNQAPMDQAALGTALGLTRARVSQVLGQLSLAGLVQSSSEGRRRTYVARPLG